MRDKFDRTYGVDPASIRITDLQRFLKEFGAYEKWEEEPRVALQDLRSRFKSGRRLQSSL